MRGFYLTIISTVVLALTASPYACATEGNKIVKMFALGEGAQIGHLGGQIVTSGLDENVHAWANENLERDVRKINDPQYEGPDGHYGLFSDSAPGDYGAYRPTYVAPPAPAPERTYIDPTAQTYCRQYSQRNHPSGRVQEDYGVACLQPNGSWRAVR